MRFEAPNYPLSEEHLPFLLSGLMIVPNIQSMPRPSDKTHIWLNMRMWFVHEAYDKAGLDGSIISQQGAAPRVYLPLIAGLKDAIASSSLYPAPDVAYYLNLDDGALLLQGQHIVGTRALTAPSQALSDQIKDLMVEKMLADRSFTHPLLRIASDRSRSRHGILIDNPHEFVSAFKVDVVKTRKTICERYSQLHLPPVDLPVASPSHVSTAPKVVAKLSTVFPGGALADLGQLRLDPLHPQRLVLPTQHLEHYAAVKALIVTAGGKYSSKGYFAFEEGIDPAAVHRSLMAGRIVNDKKDVQFFATQPQQAIELCDRAGPLKGLRVLEPSAGDGALADIARDRGAHVTVIENWPVNVAKLKAKGYAVIDQDFLTVSPDDLGKFDVIIGNPPFAKNQDIDHVMHMMKFLEPGGVLSVITSQAWQRGTQKKQVEFAEFLREIGAAITPIAKGAFKASGTLVPTFQITARAPALNQDLNLKVADSLSRPRMRP